MESRGREMRIRMASIRHFVLAVTMLGLGIVGLLHPGFVPIWNPVPATIPSYRAVLYIGPALSFISGIGVLFQRTAAIAARLLLVSLFLWLLLFRLPNFLSEPWFDVCWSVFPLMVMLAAAWVLYVWSAEPWDHKYLHFVSGNGGLRLARVLYGLSLVFFGAAHFIDVKDTLSLIPTWIFGHLFWAYFTGTAFIAAGVAVISGLFARFAVALSTLQIGLFLLLVWIPILATGPRSSFQWSETILNAALLAAAWTIANSYY
jgi:hypothetical protein